MNDRLQSYVNGDPRHRRKGDTISLAIAFLWFLFAELLQFRQALIQSVAVLFACQIASTVQYCMRKATSESLNSEAIAFYRMNLKAGMSYVAMVVASLAVSMLSGPRIEAAILDDRLRRISKDQSPTSFITAAALLASANANRLVLTKASIEKLVEGRLTLHDVSTAVVDRVNAEGAKRGIDLPIQGAMIHLDNGGQLFLQGISGESISASQLSAPNAPGSPAPPDMVAFVAPIASDTSLPKSKGLGFLTLNGDTGVISIDLDGLHCKNIVFSRCNLIYRGGSVRFENCGFTNSRFMFSPNLACQQLAHKILVSPTVDWIAS